MTKTNSASLACFRGVARSFRYFQFRGERGEDAGIVSNAKYEPSRISATQSKSQAREEGARYGNCQEL